MKILFFSEQYWPETNAPAIHVHERARLWASQGHEVTVITCAPNFPEGRLHPGYRNHWRTVSTEEGVRVVRVKSFISPNQGVLKRGLDYSSYALSAALNSLLESRPDVVISTSPQLLTATAGIFASRFHRVPHVFELRDLWPATIVAVSAMRPGLAVRMLERLELACYRSSARVLAFTNSFRADLIRRGISGDRIDVVPNGTDISRFTPRAKDSGLSRELQVEDRLVVGYMGTLGMCHGLEHILDTARVMRGDSISFLMVGAGAVANALGESAKGQGLENVRFLPRQPRERMPELWSLCDLALVHLVDDPLFQTVIPSKLYEAAAMGLPILYVGPEGEASALIRDGGMGWTMPPGRPVVIASLLRHLIKHPEERREAGARALEASKGFSREIQAERTLGVLAKAVEATSR